MSAPLLRARALTVEIGGHQITSVFAFDCGREQESPLQVGVQPATSNAAPIRVTHNTRCFMVWPSERE